MEASGGLSDDIIVLGRFDNPIHANIAKTKLDAYGIPCYLTEENLTGLTTALLSGGIRLHVFKQDEDRALQIISEHTLSRNDEEDTPRCPACASPRILRLRRDTLHQRIVQSLVRFFLDVKKTHYCQDCDHEFDL